MPCPEAVVANNIALLPVSLEVPGPKTLVKGVVACEMAVLNEAVALVTAKDEADFLVVTHCRMDGFGRRRAAGLSESALVSTSRVVAVQCAYFGCVTLTAKDRVGGTVACKSWSSSSSSDQRATRAGEVC